MNTKTKLMALIKGIASALSMVVAALAGFVVVAQAQQGTLNDKQIDNLVRRSYQYVAMYNLIHKFAHQVGNRTNVCVTDTQLKDHTMRVIARPNNDTLYITCLVDVRQDPVILGR